MLLHGDLFDVLPTLEAESFDSCVTDPPYGIGFMGKQWDSFSPETAQRKAGLRQCGKLPRAKQTNPNLKGRTVNGAVSASQIEYDRGLGGQRAFQEWTERWAREVFRVLKPGAHLVVCGAPRSHHRMMCGLEDAGFEIRDCLAWLFSQGFPKSLNFGCKCGDKALPYNHAAEPKAECDMRFMRNADVSQTVDVEGEPSQILLHGLSEPGLSAHGSENCAGVNEGREQSGVAGRDLHRAGERLSAHSDAGAPESAGERLRTGTHHRGRANTGATTTSRRGSSSSESRPNGQSAGESRDLQLASGTLDCGASRGYSRCTRCGGIAEARGWGTALKPAHEPIVLARKPFKGSLTDNVIKHGVGGLNVDGCRIEFSGEADKESAKPASWPQANDSIGTFRTKDRSHYNPDEKQSGLGRWPANVLLDPEAAAMLDEQSGELTSGANPEHRNTDKTWSVYGRFHGDPVCVPARGLDIGGASRFFYVAKPSREERDLGCDFIAPRQRDDSRKDGHPGGDNPRNRGLQMRGNFHPTVKPLALMRWLVRLVTPPGGKVLEPFGGSGTTAMACAAEGFACVLIEREADYIPIIEARVRSIAPLFTEAVNE